MRYCPSPRKGFLIIAAIGVSAVLVIMVFGVAALVGQTNTSLAVHNARSAAFHAVDMYLPGVLADYRAKGATSLTLEFDSTAIRCSFRLRPADPADALIQKLGVRTQEGDVIVTAEAAPARGPATRFTLLADPNAAGSRPYMVLSITPLSAAAE